MKQFVEVINKMCADSKDFNVIKDTLDLTRDKYEYTPEIKAALEIIKQGDEIKRLIRKLHLIKYVKFNTDKYEISEDIEKDAADKKHAYVKIVSKSDSKTVAWLCIDTNLYLVAKKVYNPHIWDGGKYPDGSYWQYVFPKGKNKTYDMKELNNFISDNRPLDIDDLLNDVDMTENDTGSKGE